MTELVKSITFAILGAVVLVAGLMTSAGIEVLILGALISAVALTFIIIDIIKKDKWKNRGE